MTLETQKTVMWEIAYAVEGKDDLCVTTTYNENDVKSAILVAWIYKKPGASILITKKTVVCEYTQLFDSGATR